MAVRPPPTARCDRCGRPIDEVQVALPCPDCAGPVGISFDSETRPNARRGARVDGLWRYGAALPLRDPNDVVSLGEGDTPVVRLPRWGAAHGMRNVFAKLEYIAPTGSFKDRGTTLVVSRAREIGARELIEDSSGNAGASVAAYAARAGIPAIIFVPAGAPAAKIAQIAATGADVVRVEGPREAVRDAAIEAARSRNAYYVGHNGNPYFEAGTQTFGFEVARWHFGHVMMPVGGGSLFVGGWRGLQRAAAPRAILPRFHLAQPTGCAPIVAAWRRGMGRPVPIERHPTIAGGAEIEHPARGVEILRILTASHGGAVDIHDDAIVAARHELATLEGIDVEPTSALAVAGVIALLRDAVIRSEDRVLIVLTGSGLKVPA
ncbi:MAG: pyridoxal-phosphate dependent enzyme [Chloroflexota bacterium]|nr:MAG: pyridoxal-phosphate dependent enzyme [Chloroflexota bacterium]